MSSGAWSTVNLAEEVVSLDASSSCKLAETSGSPIDVYYEHVSHVLTLGDPKALADSETLGRLLILGVVTGVEVYFRTLFAGVVRICPIARTHAADQQIAFGALDYYGESDLEFGLFEGSSFASEAEVRRRTKTLLGLEWKSNSSLAEALIKFDEVCQMRHAFVHAHGLLSRGNAKVLNVQVAGKRTHLVVDFGTLHLAAKACHSAVRAYNTFVYRQILERWLAKRVLLGNWKADQHLFKPLFNLCRSHTDNCAPARAYNAYVSFRPTLIKGLASARE